MINVTAAEDSLTGNGHRYLRKSPWVSSDILMTLKFNLKPNERGLVQTEGQAVWAFPADYISRLTAALQETTSAAAADGGVGRSLQ